MHILYNCFFSSENYDFDEHEPQQAHANERPRKHRTPRLGRKHYGHHEVKKGRGVRRKRRNENCELPKYNHLVELGGY